MPHNVRRVTISKTVPATRQRTIERSSMTTQKPSKTNYRPISVLPCVSEVCESFLNADLQVFACDVSQHHVAYMKNSSTTVALLTVRLTHGEFP